MEKLIVTWKTSANSEATKMNKVEISSTASFVGTQKNEDAMNIAALWLVSCALPCKFEQLTAIDALGGIGFCQRVARRAQG